MTLDGYKVLKTKVKGILQKWGIPKEDIVIADFWSKNYIKDVFDVKIDQRHFFITLYARTREKLSEQDDWDVTIHYQFHISNPHKLVLKITKESLKTKLNKWIGIRDKELYEEDFDAAFLVNGNHNYAHLMILEDHIQVKMLRNLDEFTELNVRKDEVSYREAMEFVEYNPELRYRIIDFIDICYYIAESVDRWQPPKDALE